jgi:hypothetical protein
VRCETGYRILSRYRDFHWLNECGPMLDLVNGDLDLTGALAAALAEASGDLDDVPEVSFWNPPPEVEAQLRECVLKGQTLLALGELNLDVLDSDAMWMAERWGVWPTWAMV